MEVQVGSNKKIPVGGPPGPKAFRLHRKETLGLGGGASAQDAFQPSKLLAQAARTGSYFSVCVQGYL